MEEFIHKIITEEDYSINFIKLLSFIDIKFSEFSSCEEIFKSDKFYLLFKNLDIIFLNNIF